MKPDEIKGKTENELKHLEQKLKEEIFHLRFKLRAGQLKQTTDVRKKRHDLARVKTLLNQKV